MELSIYFHYRNIGFVGFFHNINKIIAQTHNSIQ
jgi:hypothetical protein